MGRSRSRSRDRDRRRSHRSQSRNRHRSRSRDRRRRSRSRSRSRRRSRDASHRRHHSRSPPRNPPAPDTHMSDAEKKKQRLAAWKKAQAEKATAAAADTVATHAVATDTTATDTTTTAAVAAAGGGPVDNGGPAVWAPWDDPGIVAAVQGGGAVEAVQEHNAQQEAAPVWTPWDDPMHTTTTIADPPTHPPPPAAPPPVTTAAPAVFSIHPTKDNEDEEEEDDNAHGAAGPPKGAPKLPPGAIPKSVLEKRAKFEAEQMQKRVEELKRQLDPMAVLQQGEEVDPLDAFMQQEVLPEVAAKQAAEAAAREEERLKRARELAAAMESGKPYKSLAEIEALDEEEELADLEIQVPTNRVRLLIGQNGEKIKWIQKKSKCRVQVKKDEATMAREFGKEAEYRAKEAAEKLQRMQQHNLKRLQGPGPPPPEQPPQRPMTTIQIFGDDEHCEKARRLIMEAVDNREEKAKQRQRQYDKKKEEKARNKQMYYLRHAKDYETLEIKPGTSKADIRKAYRALAVKWHPDKNPNNPDAHAKFQEIQQAYDRLMSTDEEAAVHALQGGGK